MQRQKTIDLNVSLKGLVQYTSFKQRPKLPVMVEFQDLAKKLLPQTPNGCLGQAVFHTAEKPASGPLVANQAFFSELISLEQSADKYQYSKGMIKAQAIRKLGGELDLAQAMAAGEVVTKEDSGLKLYVLPQVNFVK